MLPANAGVNYFVDWDDFQASFRKEFFPLHAEAVATNVLEGTTYFQGTRNVDNYLDEFRDLVSASGYTSPKTIVVKFRRGLDVEIGDAIATMATGRPDDFDPEGWFEAAVRIDQAHATNAAFQASVQPAPAVPEVVSMEKLPTHEEVVEEVLTAPVLRTVTQAQLPHAPLVFRMHPHALFHLHSHSHLRKTALRVNSLSKAL